jgi:A/G-specific adenine glycosylase
MGGDTRRKALVRKRVITWFDKHGRDYPWRNTTNPYLILIAEILLRRTTASAVSRIFPDFIQRFGTPMCITQAQESTIAKALSSIGLQSLRAKQLKKTASILVQEYDSKVPRSNEMLQSLPGVGFYIASAVRNFAYGESVPLIDGNVVYFVSRVFGINFTGPTDPEAVEFVTQFGGLHDAKLYWGIIDLVATVCLRRKPRCGICPLAKVCNFRMISQDLG